MLFVSAGVFANSVPGDYLITSDKLVEELAANKDVQKLYEYGVAMNIIQSMINEVKNNEGEIPETTIASFKELTETANELYAKIAKENPEYNSLNQASREKVLTQAMEQVSRSVGAGRVLECLFQAGASCMGGYGSFQRASFWFCCAIMGCTDIAVLWASGGTATPEIIAAIGAQAGVCERTANVIGVTACIIRVVDVFINCLNS